MTTPVSASAPAPAEPLAGQDLAFLETLAQTRSFALGRPTSISLTPDGRTALFLRALPRRPDQSLFAFDLESARVRELVSPESLLGGGAEQLSAEERARRERMRITARGLVGYELSRDGALVLFSFGGRAWVVPSAGGVPESVRVAASNTSHDGSSPPLARRRYMRTWSPGSRSLN